MPAHSHDNTQSIDSFIHLVHVQYDPLGQKNLEFSHFKSWVMALAVSHCINDKRVWVR